MKAPSFWQKKKSVLSVLLAPMGYLYARATKRRLEKNEPFRAGLKVVCVGNLAVGGTGKTPVCLALGDFFHKQGQNFFYLNHGYRSKEQNILLPKGSVYREGLSDEAFILASKAPTVIAKNRKEGALLAQKSGAKLLKDDAVSCMVENLFPLAYVVTPNIPEAELLSGIKIESQEHVDTACRKIKELGAKNVIIKGGHFNGEESVDTLFNGENHYEIAAMRINSKNTHGTGCTYSSAICSYLALGFNLLDAVKYAKQYITSALIYGAEMNIGMGSGPVNHFFENTRNNNDGTISFGSCTCG